MKVLAVLIVQSQSLMCHLLLVLCVCVCGLYKHLHSLMCLCRRFYYCVALSCGETDSRQKAQVPPVMTVCSPPSTAQQCEMGFCHRSEWHASPLALLNYFLILMFSMHYNVGRWAGVLIRVMKWNMKIS